MRRASCARARRRGVFSSVQCDSSPFYAMGAFLDKPNVEKTTSAETNGNLLAGVSAMQGERRELGGRGSPARHALLPTAHALPATPFALAGWRVDMEVRFGGSPHRAARCGAALPHRAPRALRNAPPLLSAAFFPPSPSAATRRTRTRLRWGCRAPPTCPFLPCTTGTAARWCRRWRRSRCALFRTPFVLGDSA